MVRATFVFLALAAASASAFPLNKRIAQVISASTQKWEASCRAAGGDQRCNPLSVAAFTTLLAAAGPCDQQDNADKMVDLAKELNNNADMIRLAQIFAQQPRNTPSSLSVPYCQKAPKNKELNGLFQCQFQGANARTFVGGVALGGPGTMPFGRAQALSPLGSCPAHTSGPIPDGSQLVDLTQDPGLGNAGSGSPPADAKPTSSSVSASALASTTKSTEPSAIVLAPPSPSSSSAPEPSATPLSAQCGEPLNFPIVSSSTPTPPVAVNTPTASTSSAPAPTGPPVAPAACLAKQKRAFSPNLSIAKRIAQADLPAVAQSWQDLCLVSGGDIRTNDPCVQLAGIKGINGLLAGSDPCAQQDNADAMINFAKSAGIKNKEALIANAVAYRKHPRNALDIGGGLTPSTPFCTRAPKNQELVGIVNGQLNGVNPGLFGGPKFAVVPFGSAGTCPFGQTPNVATCTCA